MGAIPCHSWLGVAAFVWVVPFVSGRRARWVQWFSKPSGGLLLALLRWFLAIPGGGPYGCSAPLTWLEPAAGSVGAVPHHPRRSVLWVPFSAYPAFGLLLAFSGWSLAIPERGPVGCSAPPMLVRASCVLCWGGPSSFPAEGLVGEVPHQTWLAPAAGFVWVVPLHLCGRSAPPIVAGARC